jgi:hypothetical protein
MDNCLSKGRAFEIIKVVKSTPKGLKNWFGEFKTLAYSFF